MVLTEGTLVKYNGIVLEVGYYYEADEEGPEAYDLHWPGSNETYEYEVDASIIEFYKNEEDAIRTPDRETLLEFINESLLDDRNDLSIDRSVLFSDNGSGILISGRGPDGYGYSATLRVEDIREGA